MDDKRSGVCPTGDGRPAVDRRQARGNGPWWVRLTVVLAALLTLQGGIPTAANFRGVSIQVNGRIISSDVPPVIQEGRVMVPLRAVSESLGASVEWDSEARLVTIQTGQSATTQTPTGAANLLAAYSGAMADLVAGVSPSVVTVIVQNQRGAIVQGSGVIFDASGYLLTNWHVVEAAAEATVILSDGRRLSAGVVGNDPVADVAVLRVQAGNLRPAPFGDSDRLRPGEVVLAVGSPLNHRFATSVTMGIISGIGRDLSDTYYGYIQTDAALSPGNSGGPLLDMQGQVVGINTLKVDAPGVEGLSFALPARVALRIARQLVEDGRVRRAYLGVTLGEAGDPWSGEPGTGLVVQAVEAGGPADQAGIRAGDVIVSLAGTPVNSLARLLEVLERHAPGDEVAVAVLRNGSPLTLNLRLAQRPPD